MIAFLNPQLLLWIPVVVAALVLIIRKDFVKFKTQKEQIAYKKSKKRIRLFLLLSRSLILSCLIIALAVPFTTKQIITPGDPALTIFVDNSKSFDLFDRSAVEQVKKGVEGEMPVTIRQISEANRSAIGDALLSYLQGNDNVLLVSDGNNNYGRSLGDMITFAAMLNSTINALSLSPIKKDAAVVVAGPGVTTAQVENTFYVDINKAGSVQPFRLKVTVDGVVVINKIVTSGSYEFRKRFSEGYHKIVATIDADDEFLENNVYYKAVKVEPKPKVAFVSKEGSPMDELLSKIYEVYNFASLPPSLEPYSAVILNNIPAAEVNTDLLNDYVAEGNGLLVIGGYESFDMDSYKARSYKPFEALLPVIVGKGKEEEKKEVNVVLVIDKSGSTGQLFGTKSKSTVESVEKALAISIVDDLRDDDKVAVVAFDAVPYMVSEFSRLGPKKEELKDKISSLVYGGGTIVYEGLNKADELLSQVHGSKNVILISDGYSGASYWDDVVSAQRIALHGGKLFTVGVGEATNFKLMQELAGAGDGIYFEPEETQRIKVIFGKIESKKRAYNLETLNNYHFVTRDLSLDAAVSGLNTVVPKSSAMMMVTTENNDPILTVWRFGLGRVAALSTDDGSRWAGPLLTKKNSLLLTRSTNWVIGDLSRKKRFDVSAKDVNLGEVMEVNVKSDDLPEWNDLKFAKVGENIYSASFYPKKVGFYSFFNAEVAVNAIKELQSVGMNPELESLIGLSGGRMFQPSQTKDIIKKVREDSKRYKTEIIAYSWLPIVLALVIFLIEISVRRAIENKKYK
jgi:hypothetical protein